VCSEPLCGINFIGSIPQVLDYVGVISIITVITIGNTDNQLTARAIGGRDDIVDLDNPEYLGTDAGDANFIPRRRARHSAKGNPSRQLGEADEGRGGKEREREARGTRGAPTSWEYELGTKITKPRLSSNSLRPKDGGGNVRGGFSTYRSLPLADAPPEKEKRRTDGGGIPPLWIP